MRIKEIEKIIKRIYEKKQIIIMVIVILSIFFYKFIFKNFVSISQLILGISNLIILYIYTLETKKMRETHTKPSVSIYLESASKTSQGIMNLIIINDGNGLAKNIKLNLITDIKEKYFNQNKKMGDLSIFKKGIPYLAKNQKLSFLFLNLHENQTFLDYEKIEIEVIYENNIRTRYRRYFDVSMNYSKDLIYTSNLTPLEKFFDWGKIQVEIK